MKVTEVKNKTDILASMIKAEHPGMKLTEAYIVANGIFQNFVICNSLKKALPYDSNGFIEKNCDV